MRSSEVEKDEGVPWKQGRGGGEWVEGELEGIG